MSEATYYLHPQALVESEDIGERTRVSAFAHIEAGARVGADCVISGHTLIQGDVVVGDRVTISSGVQLFAGLRVEDDVTIGPNVTLTNGSSDQLVIRRGATIGANATLLSGVTIGQNALVGAGAVVTHAVPPFAVVVGNPARIIRYVQSAGSPSMIPPPPSAAAPASDNLGVEGVSIHRAPIIVDMRGNLSARELGDGLPFAPQRYFVVMDVPSKEVRGAHAHRECGQLLICLKGSLSCMVDDGTNRSELALSSPEIALHLPPMVWGVQYKYTADAVLLVLASHPYDAEDYIRDYDQFLEERRVYESKAT